MHLHLMHRRGDPRVGHQIHQQRSGERTDAQVSDELVVHEFLEGGPGQVERRVFGDDGGFTVGVPFGRVPGGGVH